MDENFKETIGFLATLLGPFLVWFSGKFLYNKWEKRRIEANTTEAEVVAKQKEVDLAIMYEGMARRAAEDTLTKSDRWRQLEGFFNEKIKNLETKISDQDLKISDQAIEIRKQADTIIGMSSQIRIIELEKANLECENANLKQRVAFLEAEMNNRNGNC